MAAIIGIVVSVVAAGLMKLEEKKTSSEKTVYDYRDNPEVLNDFIR